jgi:pSer/pThr/pTyr-binding forkhead associated (FHA) protein
VIGRGDDAGWVIADGDLSRAHAEIRRTWDGTRARDLGSKNGTRVDGEDAGDGVELHDGALVELGNVAMRFRDPAERHLRGGESPRAPLAPPRIAPRERASVLPFYAALAICALAIVALAWVLAS